MKFSNRSSYETLSRELRRNLTQTAAKYESVLRRAVSILTTNSEISMRIPRRKKELLVLAMISWYLPKELSVLVQVELQERRLHLDSESSIQLGCLLSSEPEMILQILESSILGRTEREVFGNIIAIQPKIQVFSPKLRKPLKGQRIRGYRDKGSLNAASYLRQEWLNDYQSTRDQFEIEQERLSREDVIQISLGFIQ